MSVAEDLYHIHLSQMHRQDVYRRIVLICLNSRTSRIVELEMNVSAKGVNAFSIKCHHTW